MNLPQPLLSLTEVNEGDLDGRLGQKLQQQPNKTHSSRRLSDPKCVLWIFKGLLGAPWGENEGAFREETGRKQWEFPNKTHWLRENVSPKRGHHGSEPRAFRREDGAKTTGIS